MKILILSYCYPPSLTPRAFRWAAIAERWAKEGHRVDVICGAALARTEGEIVNGVYVHRVGSAFLGKLRGGTGERAEARQASAAGRIRAGLVALARKAGRYVWRRIYWPDYACLWYWHALRKARALQSVNGYDVMYSSSIPFTGHLAALGVKNKYPGLRWVVDIGDPFCFSDGVAVNNFALYEGVNIRYEKKVFLLADAISVTTRATGERYRGIFPSAASKISVIPPLLSVEPATENGAPCASREDGKIRLVFLGTLYRSIRDPGNLLRLFAGLLESEADLAERLELHFYGDTGSCREQIESCNGLAGKKIFLHGLVDRKTAAAAMRDADILVNIGNGTVYQLPSKVVEYLFMMKPILNLAQSPDDSSADFFRQYPGVFCVVGDEAVTDADLFGRLAEFIRHPPHIDAASRLQCLPSFQVGEIASRYLGLAGHVE